MDPEITPADPNPNPNPNPTPSPAPAPAPSLISTTEPGKDPNAQVDPAKPTDPKPADPKAPDPNAPAPLTFDDIPDLPEEFDREDPLATNFLDLINNPPESKAEMASRLVNLQKQVMEANQKVWLDTQQGWIDAIKADPKIGGEALAANLGLVTKLIDRFAAESVAGMPDGGQKDAARTQTSELLKEAFTFTGAGNEPNIVKFLIWTAGQLGEGAPLSGAPANGGTQISRADKLFGT